MAAKSSSSGRRDETGRAALPLSEIIGATVGAIAALGLIGGLAFEALTHADAPPQLSVTPLVEYLQAVDGGEPSRVIPFRVANDGGQTAAEVTVVARAAGADGEEIETEIVFDFVPRGSARDGAVVLPAGSGPPAFRISAWREP